MFTLRERCLRFVAPLTALLVCVSLGGCVSSQALLRQMAPRQADAYAQSLLRSMAAGDSSPVTRSLDPNLRGPATDQQMASLTGEFRKHTIVAITLVGYRQVTTNGATDRYLDYQLQFTDGWGVANVVLRDLNGAQVIEGLSASSIPAGLKEINALNLGSKGPLHYLFLLASIACAVFMLAAVRLAFRIRGGRPWLRALGALVGVGQFALNWTTGVIGFNLTTIQLFGLAWGRVSDYAPFVVLFPIPVGACWVWWKYLDSRGVFPSNTPDRSPSPAPEPSTAGEPSTAAERTGEPDPASPSSRSAGADGNTSNSEV